MKTIKTFFVILIYFAIFSLESCGPVIISSRPSTPTPDWFYPNRVVNVRYMYFPEYLIYYDLSLRQYIYLDNGVWITVTVLPPRFQSINFKRARQVRVSNYFGDNIPHYHSNIRVPVRGQRDATQSTNRRTNNRTTRTGSRRGL